MDGRGFERWLDGFDGPRPTVCTVNRTQPDPVQNLVVETFAGQSVDVTEADVPDSADDVVIVIEDGDVTATSSLDSLRDAFLIVNSDSFRTSTAGIDRGTVPDVLAALDETVFAVRGYPASNKEKLLLTVISRHVERQALDAGSGTVRAMFQRLSRLDDERGTREVYERLVDTGLDVHVYGRPDGAPPIDGLTLHEGAGAPYRDSWCVVFRPPPGKAGHAAVVAVTAGPGEWRGAWTYDRQTVEAIADYVATL